MTREAARSVQGRNLRADNVDPLASLWEHVTFAKLPWDAPSELTELVVNVENPKRVYAVHRASRRHNFQLLVEKFVVQLRYGCDSPNCTTSTCFTFRKRIVGKAPIRRYNTTSARTLAVYLASQDNPEAALCPYVHVPKAPPVALSSLVLTPKHPRKRPSLSRASNKDSREESHCKEGDNGNEKAPSEGGAQCDTPARPASPAFAVNDRPPSKDYRSFAANVFGSVAFKMLEWLTPNSIDKLAEMADGFDNAPAGKRETTRASSPTEKQRSPSPAKRNNPHPPDVVENKRTSQDTPRTVAPEVEKQPVTTQPASRRGSNPAGSQRRNSNARVRKSSASNPKRQLSIEAFTDSQSPDDKLSGLRSPRLPGLPQEKATKPFMSAALPIARSMSQSSDDFIKRCSSPDILPSTEEATVEQKDLSCSSPKPSETSTAQSTEGNTESVTSPLEQDREGELLPQSLSKLSVEIVDLLCDILQEDGTGESRMLEPPTVPRKTRRTIKRKRISGLLYPAAMKVEWKLFIEQSLFHVLSDPRAIVSSFTTDAGLLDSYALWYCMLRLTRVAPTLVFDSLWMAVASLFAPPKRLHSLRSPTTRFFRIPERTLNSEEASHLMTICLHALVAAAPVLTNPTHLLDISRLRSHGLSIDNSVGSSRIPPEICLQYDDVFSDELLLRLARRVFAAITTRRTFNELVEADVEFDEAAPEPDILEALLSQLDSLTDEPASSIAFSPDERDMHRKRVPTLLLDWARAIMLGEWDGSPEVPGTGPFGGALALIAALHKKRRELHLGDGSFRSDYFSERLDSVEMPIAWLSHQSSRNRHHLLDYPYMFSPATLVSYFRAINFSRMSRSFEESSSLQNRMRHIMQDGSLISNDAHKQLLQDLLKTASSQYLILEIRRMDPLKDAFDQLWRRQERELLRPLKVHLGEESGEEGFDSGGVQQEFFRLAIAEALDPKYGLFTIDERTRMTWFRPGSPAEEWKFELVGLLISIAVYNGLTLPVTFPMALYRKLLGEPVQELHHIEDGWPDLTNGLTNLLEWDEANGKVEDVFARTYEFSIEYFGEHVSREMTSTSSSTTPSPSSSTASSHILPSALKNASASSQQQHQQQASPSSWPQFSNFAVVPAHKENPEDAPLVTNSNRNAYVSDYIRYLTQVSVAPQYAAFERGFRTVLHPKSLTLLTSPLLQSIVEGTQEIDISELKRAARYVGWDSRHRTIKDFWSIVKRYDDTMKRKLLEFVTASDRVPVGGMRNVTFVIQKNGEEGLGEEEDEEEANQRVVVLEGESHGEQQADSSERRENRADGAEDPQAQPAMPQTTRKKAWHLPTAYTCYGTLLLPEYKDKETLRERLAMALENASGFGFA